MFANKPLSFYYGRSAVITTKHHKAEALALPLKAGLGLTLTTAELDTDLLGTFTGEVERSGTPLETAMKKARLGMESCGAKLGLANEGSFGPHPYIPFISGCHEVLVFIDDELGLEISESIVSSTTNFAHIDCRSLEEAEEFLARVKFPRHALIVRPNKSKENLFQKLSRSLTGKLADVPIRKGIQDREALLSAIALCKGISQDGLAHIETDMRAHMNPTRMRVLRALGVKLARRMRCACPACQFPGFGITGAEGSLSCEECGYPSEAPAFEIHSCANCRFKKTLRRNDGITNVEAMYCHRCNP